MEYYGDTFHSITRLVFVYKRFLWPFQSNSFTFQEFNDEVNAGHNNRAMN
jgi:hypothetical protein